MESQQPLPSTYSAAKDQTTIHKGTKEVVTSRLNARDLVANVEGWKWGPASSEQETVAAPEGVEPDAEEAPVEEVDPGSQDTVVDFDTLRAAEAEGTAPAEPSDVSAMFLTDAAIVVLGSADLKTYLNGFPFASLRELSKLKFSHTIHHRATKHTSVSQLIELEEARILATAND